MEAGKRKILEALEIAVVIVSFDPITSQSCRNKLQFEAFVTEPWSLPLICCEDGAVVAWERRVSVQPKFALAASPQQI